MKLLLSDVVYIENNNFISKVLEINFVSLDNDFENFDYD